MKLTKSTKPQIDQIYRDDDGWWVILKGGWTIDDCIGAREDTKAKLLSRIKEAKQTGDSVTVRQTEV